MAQAGNGQEGVVVYGGGLHPAVDKVTLNLRRINSK